MGKTTCAAAAALALAETPVKGGATAGEAASGASSSSSPVLIVSTDPAHSLGDVLAVALGPEPRRIATRSGELWALELAAGAALERWLAPRRSAVADIALRGTYLDRDDVESLLALTPPGVDELVALAEVVRRAAELGCAEVVVDTAPTAHTLRLLAMPEALRRFAALLDALEAKHRLLGARFGAGHQPDEADQVIAGIDREGAALAALLRDPDRAGFWWVTLAEPLALAETRDGLAALDAAGIAVREVIVNRLVPTRAARADQPRQLAQLMALTEAGQVFAGRALRLINEQRREPRGLPALRKLVASSRPVRGAPAWDRVGGAADFPGKERGGRRAAAVESLAGLAAPAVGARPPGSADLSTLLGKSAVTPAALGADAGRPGRDLPGHSAAGVATDLAGRSALASLPRQGAASSTGIAAKAGRPVRWGSRLRSPGLPAPIRALLAPDSLRLLLFGGKGGVGKTTCAAAAALGLAAVGRRVLLLSTDPAHSLGDVLGVALGDDERPVPGAPGLVARELDAEQSFERWRARSGDGVDAALTALTGQVGLGAVLDRPAEDGLSGFVPPGLDEVVALVTLLDAVLPPASEEEPESRETAEPAFDLVVVDTAPTGHTLRLLALPEVALAWDHALLSLLLKYREVRPPGALAADLVELSRGLKRFTALLQDPARARFVPVARPAELPALETGRLLAELGRLGIAVPAVLVNAVGDRDGLPAWIARLRRGIPGACAMIVASAAVPPPHGVAGLAGWSAGWRIALPVEKSEAP